MSETVLVTRFCHKHEDGSLRSSWDPSFIWPWSGPVEAPEWDPTPECGYGLHGWLEGNGKANCWMYTSSDTMLVVEVLRSDIIDLDGKVKFPKGDVIFCGTREEVTQFMAERGYENIIYAHKTVPDLTNVTLAPFGKVNAGHYCTIEADNSCTINAKSHANIKAKFQAIVWAGNFSTIEVEDNCSVHAGDHCRVTRSLQQKFTSGGTIETGQNCYVDSGPSCSIEIGVGTVIRVSEANIIRTKNVEDRLKGYYASYPTDPVFPQYAGCGKVTPGSVYKVNELGFLIPYSEEEPCMKPE